MPETILEVLELCQRAANEVVGAAPGACEMLGKLGERPVLVEMEPAGLALVIGEHGAVHIEEPLLQDAGGQHLGGGSICQGQDLDMLPDSPELTAGRDRTVGRAGGASPPSHQPPAPVESLYAAAGSPIRVAVSVDATRLRAGINAAATAPTATTPPPTITAGVSPATKVAPET